MQTEIAHSQADNTSTLPKARWEEPRIEIEYFLVAQAQDPDEENPIDFAGPLAVTL